MIRRRTRIHRRRRRVRTRASRWTTQNGGFRAIRPDAVSGAALTSVTTNTSRRRGDIATESQPCWRVRAIAIVWLFSLTLTHLFRSVFLHVFWLLDVPFSRSAGHEQSSRGSLYPSYFLSTPHNTHTYDTLYITHARTHGFNTHPGQATSRRCRSCEPTGSGGSPPP